MYQLCKVPHNDNDETDESRQENENGKYDLVKDNETMVLNKEKKRLSLYMHALSTHLIVFRCNISCAASSKSNHIEVYC